jgi:hypothetical protein
MAGPLARLDVMALDELGSAVCESSGQLLFHLISKLYETTSIIVTTNGRYGEPRRLSRVGRRLVVSVAARPFRFLGRALIRSDRDPCAKGAPNGRPI